MSEQQVGQLLMVAPLIWLTWLFVRAKMAGKDVLEVNVFWLAAAAMVWMAGKLAAGPGLLARLVG